MSMNDYLRSAIEVSGWEGGTGYSLQGVVEVGPVTAAPVWGLSLAV